MTLDNVDLITAVLPSLVVFYLMRYYMEDKVIINKVLKVIEVVVGTTFGIYLFHPFTRFTLEKVFRVVLNYNVYIGIVLVQISGFVICSVVTWALKKIPVVRKFL